MELEFTGQPDALRKGETGRAPFRSGRFFAVGGKWFFTTREGKDHGPFSTKAEAETQLRIFLRGVSTTNLTSTADMWGEAK